MSNMLEKAVFGKIGVPLMTKFLDLSSLRHKLTAGNIANVSTPDYKSKDIDFHGELKKAIGDKKHLAGEITHEKHIPLGRSAGKNPEIIVNKRGSSNGINNVDIDREVANMAQNQIYYTIGAKLLAKKFEGLRNAIRSK